mgnify:CR=1 FL=1
MSLLELFIIALGLSMDAFAVSICKGLSMQKLSVKNAAIVGCYFGGFQALMPAIGFMLGYQFREVISALDHWFAFVLLSIIGIGMIRDARSDEEEDVDSSVGFKSMFPLAVATSIDALAVGVTFAFLNVNIVPAVSFIGLTTFLFGIVGVKIGNVFGLKFKSKAELAGGIILILMGFKILLEHLGVISF